MLFQGNQYILLIVKSIGSLVIHHKDHLLFFQGYLCPVVATDQDKFDNNQRLRCYWLLAVLSEMGSTACSSLNEWVLIDPPAAEYFVAGMCASAYSLSCPAKCVSKLIPLPITGFNALSFCRQPPLPPVLITQRKEGKRQFKSFIFIRGNEKSKFDLPAF